MEEKSERSSLWVSMAIAAAAIGFIVWFGLYILDHRPRRLHLINPKALPTQISLSLLDELWLTPNDQQLIVAFRDETGLKTNIAFPDDLKRPIQTIDWSQVAGSSIASASNASGISGRPATDPGQVLQYAISDDGMQAAWAWEAKLFVSQTADLLPGKAAQFRPRIIQLGDPSAVTAISFLPQEGRIAVLHFHGKLSIWDVETSKVVLGNIMQPGDWKIVGRGSMRGLYGSARSPVLINGNSFTGFPAPLKESVAAPTADGSFAVGTRDGIVFSMRSKDASPLATIGDSGAITAIAPYEDGLLIASGERSGLFLISSEGQVEKLAPAPPMIKTLAVSARSQRIVYATSTSLIKADLEWRRELDELSFRLIAFLFSSIGVIAFIRVIVLDAMRLYQISKSSEQPPTAAPPPEGTPPEGTSPKTVADESVERKESSGSDDRVKSA